MQYQEQIIIFVSFTFSQTMAKLFSMSIMSKSTHYSL